MAKLSLRRFDVAGAIPGFLVIALAANRDGFTYSLTKPLNVYDEGLLLTLSNFAGDGFLPYRDLWTFYGPGTSVLGVFLELFAGRTLLVHRISSLVILMVLVLGIYVLVKPFVGMWPASVIASTVALMAPPRSYAFAFAFIVWGIYLALLAENQGSIRVGRLASGLALIGLAFLGRPEFIVIAPVGVAAAAWQYRRRLTRAELAGVAAAGLVPPIAFVSWLLVFVSWDVLFELFYRYPVVYYALPRCRGLPTPWGPSVRAVFGPLDHGIWTANDILLALGNLGSVIVGIALIGLSVKRAFNELRFVFVVIGTMNLYLFVLMRPRVGGEPYPVLPFALIGLALLIHAVGRRSPVAARRSGKALSTVLVVAMLVAYVPGTLESWTELPSYDRVLGPVVTDPASLVNSDVLHDIERAVAEVSDSGEPIFVALDNNAGHFANATALYWVTDRPPTSVYYEFNPCLTDRQDIQQRIVRDLAEVSVVLTATFFPNPPPFSEPATALDEYLQSSFVLVETWSIAPAAPGGVAQRYELLTRGESEVGRSSP